MTVSSKFNHTDKAQKRYVEMKKRIHSEITVYKLPDTALGQITYNGVKGYINSTTLKLDYQRCINGYKTVRVGNAIEHQHRLAFRILGIDIRGMDIHHINYIKDDNRFQNLRVMRPEDHTELHRAERIARALETKPSTGPRRSYCQP